MKERHQKIYEILNKRGSVTIEQLTQDVFASEATIRRDLNKMEQQGLLLRTWGGAVSAKAGHCDPPVLIRKCDNVRLKKKIAQNALKLLKDNTSLFLPSGTTITEFAKLLYTFENLTVITTGLDVIDIIKNHLSIKIVTPGGELYENYDFAGALTGDNIDKLNADFLFFSCSGITSDGFTSQDAVRLDVIRKMHENSTKTVLLVDTSKVGKKYIYKGFGFENIDFVIMDKLPEDNELINILGEKLIISKT